MTNNVDRSFIKKMIASEKSEKLTEEKKDFLLNDKSVLEAIIAGLVRDFKYI
jgi:hypothetical protein|tara:strand:- start:1433 stop:1588 length:156 start_codon:yes stop_codon:yes gene_type:complete